MKILYGVEEKFWFLFAGFIVMYWSQVGYKLETMYLTGDTFSAVHNAVGYGIIYASIFTNIFLSIIAGLLSVLFIKNKVTIINALVTLSPLVVFYFWPNNQETINASALQLAIIHPLLIYITLRAIAPRINVSISVLGANCRPLLYPFFLVGIMLCAPIALAAFYGSSLNGFRFSLSFLVFGISTIIFFMTKKFGHRIMEILSAFLFIEVSYFIYNVGPKVIKAGAEHLN